MSPRTAVRRVVAPHTEGTLVRMLSLPARLHLRWLVIGLLMAAALGLYGHVLATASPMPPSKAPVSEAPASEAPATDSAPPSPSPAPSSKAPEMGPATSSPPPPSPVPS